MHFTYSIHDFRLKLTFHYFNYKPINYSIDFVPNHSFDEKYLSDRIHADFYTAHNISNIISKIATHYSINPHESQYLEIQLQFITENFISHIISYYVKTYGL